jgi:hypothetical protein
MVLYCIVLKPVDMIRLRKVIECVRAVIKMFLKMNTMFNCMSCIFGFKEEVLVVILLSFAQY